MFKMIALWLVMIITTVIDGAALMILWQWFVVPSFALPLLSLRTAMGLSILIEFVVHPYAEVKEKSFWIVLIEGSANSLVRAGMFLLLGLVIHFWK